MNTIQKGEGYVLRLTSAEPYFISVVVVDNYGRKSEKESPLLIFHRIRECLWQIVVRMCLLNSLRIKRKERFGYHPKTYLEIRI
ncbi:hypothetical protein NXV02_27550 [Bacteroides ovatus]|nr:hypothetical protein [Bacteroides ovatus]